MKKLTLVLWLLPFHRAAAQTDSAAFGVAVAQFHRLLAPENNLYNGGEYVDYASNLKSGIPYFGSKESYDGSVLYDGIRYDHLKLWYDLVYDEVVTVGSDGGFRLTLNSPRVASFTLGDRRFLRITKDDTHPVHTGFYELLYDGRVRLLRRTTKDIQELTTTEAVERYVETDSSYYLVKEGQYDPLYKKKSVLAALADKKKEIQVFIRKNKIDLKKDKDAAFIQIITYYDGLPHEEHAR
ncbi:hypothetical protein [Dinghuibacter silviterrae]|uniref:Uncharacterized protein n=1 Tax=Dinghuibacter silviterrae TaxID=1539049 RepID=A0A4R8DR89_9BACT|nr:hypothetical protein [Dinghuibacter silviterrae]TDX00318.1 hypothetical protein EDB95_1339 [Dinghuibacter silviterrae]